MPDIKVHEMLGVKPHLNKKVNQTDELRSQCYLGVEVELENALQILNKPMQYWRAEGDGSLRKEGIELVFPKPMQGKEVLQAYEELENLVQGTKAEATQYCSTHIHMNFLSSTSEDVMKFLFLYLLLEDGLARYCGPNRENNLFCLTVSNAEEQMQVLNNMYRSHISKKEDIVRCIARGGGQNGLKYSALNLGALTQYGTLESRLSGALTTKEDLLRWTNILLSIRSYAAALPALDDILVRCSALGPLGLVQDVLQEQYPRLQQHFREEEIYDAIDRIQDIMIIE